MALTKMKLFELTSENLLSFWDAAEQLGLDGPYEKLHDATLPWINNNSKSSIDRVIRDKKFVDASHLLFYFKKILGSKVEQFRYTDKLGTIEGFKTALDKDITLWRGGSGQFDSDFNDKRKWVSFTATRKRVNSFSVYDGTFANNRPWPDNKLEKNKHYWIIELKIPLKNILLYLPHGVDDEVIVPASSIRDAKVIKQT